MRLRSALVAILLFAPMVAIFGIDPPKANAGDYEVRACVYEAPLHFDGRYVQYQAKRVDVVQTCDRQARGKIGIYQTRKGTPFASGEGSAFWWQAPPGASFIGSRVFAKLKNANGIAAQIFAMNPEGGYYSLDANTKHDGQEREMSVDFHTQPRSQVIFRLACLTNPPCSNRAKDVKAFFEARHITLRLRDASAPTVSVSGELFERPASQSIYRGKVGYGYSAADSGGGVWQPYAEINGSIVELGAFGCAGAREGFADRTRPCPSTAARQASFDTSAPPFTEGVNRLRICVRDYATAGGSNVGCSPMRQITVDNLPPTAPGQVQLEGGEGWRAENEFNLRWNVAPDQTTAIVATHYRLEDPESGAVLVAERQSPSKDRLDGLTVPRPGQFRLRLWLRDAAGNQGPSSTVLLRFDDQRPFGASPRPAPVWLAASDFPYRHEIEPLQPAGPSGVLGYAFTLSADGPIPPCSTGRCKPVEVVAAEPGGPRTVDIERLEEGRYWLSSAAVSGAMLRSAEPQSVALRVDLGDPITRLEGVPAGWSRVPVELTAYAEDDLSGMRPVADRGSPQPVTVIELEGGESWQRIGPMTTATIRGEGTHRIRYWARDLAGNANDGRRLANGHRHDPPGRASVRIDWTAPKIEFTLPDWNRPELIQVRAYDRHSGVANGQIGIRPAASEQPFRALQTRTSPGGLFAQLPSDSLPDGPYELEVLAWDRAGNRSRSTLREDGQTMIVTVPVKPPSRIYARFGGGREVKRTVTGQKTTVIGRVKDHRESPVAGAAVEIVESFFPGSRIPERRSEVRTDDRGNFRASLAAGPSRRVVARFRGSPELARSESVPIRLLSRAKVGLRLSPQVATNGQAIRMRGRVWGRGALLPHSGKLVAIQYLDPTRRRWRPVDLLRTDRRGRFRFRYRFRTVTSPQRFLFRAVAPAEAGWPYRPARSGASAVVVYPR